MFSVISTQAAGGAWLSGAGIGIGLFAIVGAQSAFILRQGIMRQHVVPIIATCFAIDAGFIFASVAGLRTLTDQLPWLTTVLLWGGVAFLGWYALQSARRALSGGGGMQLDDDAEQSLRTALMAAAGFSIINPHFWLDMMVVGSIAQNFQEAKLGFAAGTLTASTLWLIVLGAGSRLFAPLFSNAKAWRILDGMIALVMAFMALRLAMWS